MADGSVVQVLQDGYKELIASKSKKWISGDNELKPSSVETKVKGYNLGFTRFYGNIGTSYVNYYHLLCSTRK